MKLNHIQDKFTIINYKNNIIDPYNDFILLINYQDMLNNLKNSYNNNNNNIYKQFLRDYDRCQIYINNIKESNYELFIKYFELLFIVNNYNIYDLYLFCTQAIMGYCLEILHTKLHQDFYIGELNNSKPLIYNIISENNKIIINIKKKLRIFFITQDGSAKTLYRILIKLHIPLYNNEDSIMIYKILKNKNI